MNEGSNRKLISTVAALALYFTFSVAAYPQFTAESFRKYLVDQARFTPEELDALIEGKAVVKALPSSNKQEVVVVGVVRFTDLPQVSMRAFRESISQKTDTSRTAGGKFGRPPSANDLIDLELEDRDFRQLRKCVVGNCDLNMSAAWIRQFETEIDWEASDHREHASQLIRQMLAEYAANYLAKGSGSLGEYNNRRKPVRLSETHRLLLDRSLFISEFAPELYEFIARFPGPELQGVESDLFWSTVDFGLNPTTTISHTVAHTVDLGGEAGHVLVNRQLYSSRYLDSSLSLTLLFRFAENDEAATYLIFTDRSWSDALGGMLGGFTRRVVENEGVERVTGVLDSAGAHLEIANKTPTEPESRTDPLASADRITAFLAHPAVIPLFVALVAALAILLFLRRRQNSVE
jgi:hypothetical protein